MAQNVVKDSIPTITRQTLVGVGHAGILDTYLSPEHYGGLELHFMSKVDRVYEGAHWWRQFTHHGSFATAKYRDDNGRELYGQYRFQYAWLRNLIRWENFILAVGPRAEGDIGFLYNTRNGNNPAQATFHLDVAPMVYAELHFPLWQRPFALTYEVAVPALGLMFTPQYGQSYYEIFSRGNYDHNIQPIYPGNAPSMEQQLMLRFDLGRTTFTIGYLGDYRQYKVNSLKYHHYTHALMVGVVRRFELLKLHP